MSGPELARLRQGRPAVRVARCSSATRSTRSTSRTPTSPSFKPFPRNELRRIAEKLGGLNGFEIHRDDGFLYGPLWFKGEVVKINLETGAIEVDRLGLQDSGRRQHRSAEPRQSLRRRHRHRRRVERQPHQQGQEAGRLDEARPRQSRLRFARPPVRHLDDRQRHLPRRQAHRRRQDHRRGQARHPGRPRGRHRGRQGDGACGRRVQLSHGRRPERRGDRRAARARRHPCLSDRHLGRARGTCCCRAGSPTPSRRSTARPASWWRRSADFAAPVDALEAADGTIYVAELGERQSREGEPRRQDAQHRRQGTARAGGAWPRARAT